MNIESFFQEVQNILATKIQDDEYKDKLILSAEDENIQAIVNQYYNKNNKDARTCASHLYKVLKNSVGIKKPAFIKTYEAFTSYITESNKIKSGKSSFNIFLDCIDLTENIFNSSNYLNTGDYHYFFLTDTITNDANLRNIFKHKISLPKAFPTLEKLKKEKLTFYFGIDEKSFDYGIYDIVNNDLYEIGEFKFDNDTTITFNNNCIIPIKNKLNKINIENTKILKDIKNRYDDFIKDVKVSPIIKDENTLVWRYDKNIFRQEDMNEDKLNIFINSWIYKNNLNNKITGFSIISNDSVIFNIKPKNISNIIIK